MGNPGPWRLYSAVIAAADWPALKQKAKRIEAKNPGGIEFCRIEFDPGAYPIVYRRETDSLTLKDYRQLGTRPAILCLLALAPNTEPADGFQPTTTDDAIRMAGEALAALPEIATGGKKRLQPVNFSDGWAMMEPLPPRGEWERDCVPLHQPDAVRDILERLGIVAEQPNIGSPATSSRWRVHALGGELKAWIFRQLICTRHAGSRNALSEDEIVRLFQAWARFVDDAQPLIRLGSFVRHTISELLHAEPLPTDLDSIRSAEQHDNEFSGTEGDFDFWPANSVCKTAVK
jgi:hypothetical protein